MIPILPQQINETFKKIDVNQELINMQDSTKSIEDIYKTEIQDSEGSENLCKAIITWPAFVVGGLDGLKDGDPISRATETYEAANGFIDGTGICDDKTPALSYNPDAPAYVSDTINKTSYLGGIGGNSHPSEDTRHCNGLSYNASNC